MSEPRPEIELLDEWEAEPPPHWSETRIARLVLGSGAVVVALVVFVILGGTMRDANQPSPPVPSATLPVRSATTAPYSMEPPALEADDPLEPLQITLVDQSPTLAGSLASYDVKVCVSPTSAGVGSDTVRVSLDSWLLRTAYYGEVRSPVSGGPAPAFPSEVRLGKGQCVRGWVTFPSEPPEGPHVIAYVSNRFEWTWYLSW